LFQIWGRHRTVIAALNRCFRFSMSCSIFKRNRLEGDCDLKSRSVSDFLTSIKSKGGTGEMCETFFKLSIDPTYDILLVRPLREVERGRSGIITPDL